MRIPTIIQHPVFSALLLKLLLTMGFNKRMKLWRIQVAWNSLVSYPESQATLLESVCRNVWRKRINLKAVMRHLDSGSWKTSNETKPSSKKCWQRLDREAHTKQISKKSQSNKKARISMSKGKLSFKANFLSLRATPNRPPGIKQSLQRCIKSFRRTPRETRRPESTAATLPPTSKWSNFQLLGHVLAPWRSKLAFNQAESALMRWYSRKPSMPRSSRGDLSQRIRYSIANHATNKTQKLD